ncbi:AAA family ATPase [Candidatus Bipolaricaulota bacterium]|nr:AAA family ATPase [Candidatus Bipolaricaulota bacterium]
MKVAIVGKGGVGKSTISALLGTYGVERGREVIAIDADPDMNLSSCLGVKNTAIPLIELEDLIAERAGGGGLVKLNPKVSDIPDKFYEKADGVKLMVFGTVWSGGSGCTCPENAFLREVLNHLMLERKEVVVVDMEAGIEHLGRGTGEGVDALVAVVEPDHRSLETKWRIEELAEDIGLAKTYTVCNKVRGAEDREFLLEALEEKPLGFIPYSEEIRASSRRGEKVSPDYGQLRESIKEVWAGLVNELRG